MPIRPEFRAAYRTPEAVAARQRVREREGNRCEACGKRHLAELLVTRDGTGRWAEVLPVAELVVTRDGTVRWREYSEWRDANGARSAPPRGWTPVFRIRCVLTVAHRNHDPWDNRDENLALWCQFHHNGHDKKHRAKNAHVTRSTQKDGRRPLLAAAGANQ